MNPQKCAVLIDSGCDLPESVRKRYDIFMLPLHVHYKNEPYLDGVNIDPMMVYRRFPLEIPTTSTPSIAEAQDMYRTIADKGYEKLIVVTISSALTGTFNALRLAAQDFDDLTIYLFDSRNISVGAGLLAIWAGRLLEKGLEFNSICKALEIKKFDTNVFFYMDTLKYLQKGGRIGRVAGAIGSVLNLKPIISCGPDGRYDTVGKFRGAKLGQMRLLAEVIKYSIGHKCLAIVCEGDAHEDMKHFSSLLKTHEQLSDFTVLFEHQITATMAINTGPGLIGIGILRDPDSIG